MIIKVLPDQTDGTDPSHAVFPFDISNIKPGKQQAVKNLLNHLAISLQDGKLDVFELVGLAMDAKGLT